jgi:hypothetical protein
MGVGLKWGMRGGHGGSMVLGELIALSVELIGHMGYGVV